MTNELIYQTMVQTCPELPHLVEDLDLINPSTGRRYGVSEEDERRREKLVSIARRVLNRGRIYTPEQVISLLGEKLNIPRERAVKGFSMMKSTGVLSSSSGAGIRLTA